MELKRGEVYWVNFDPSIGGEIQKTRPAIIISNNSSNTYLNRVQVIPLSSNTNKIYPSETIVILGNKKGKAIANQITTISKLRVKNKIGSVTTLEMNNIENALKLQLGLGFLLH